MTNRRVIIAGIAGAGKTTFARRLALAWNIPHVEIDALYHGESWVPRSAFMEDVKAVVGRPGWVIDSLGHKDSKAVIWPRATDIIWLDYPRRTIFYRVFTRSVYRVVTRKELWNGNRETWKGWLNPDHPVRMIFREYTSRKRKIQGLIDEKAEPFTLIRFYSPAAAEKWLAHEETPAHA